ncbi:unnamed protein product [Cylindrotheca closterium]|uniref:Uncharacterized protein n=1 Tax=Cylindrotheca closterium TaxID=2856 RepID=A0AAD2CLG0_9STRA|nr:unnamed protein product [Cylindrotheca closterium]
MSKTMTTLTRLRQHYEEEQDQQEEEMEREQEQKQQREESESRDDLGNRGFTPLPFNSKRSIDVVEFNPEELNNISPLKPEEADESQLADFLQGDDLSFLQEVKGDPDANVPNVPQPKSTTMHRIPSDFLVTFYGETPGNKRRRLSSMDDGL